MINLLLFVNLFVSKVFAEKCVLFENIKKKTLPFSVEAFESFKYSISDYECTKNSFILVDFTKSSSEDRFYYFDIKNRKINLIYSTKVSHGINSGKNYPNSFSNKIGSRKSSLGLYYIESSEKRSHELKSYPLIGLQNTNTNAYVRGITIHSADYVSKDFAGRSSGCFALSKKSMSYILEKDLKDTYLYSYFQ